MNSEETRDALARCRDQIDIIDIELLELLNRRTRVVEEIGRIKEALDLPIYEPKREDHVIRHVTANNPGPLTPDALQRIFERIIDEMRSLQRMRRQQQTGGTTECS
jgi:chorismate mutase-like protein